MPLKSSGIIVVEKPSPASVCVSQQQQVLFATTTTSAVSSQKSVADLQYCDYYESNEQHAQQQHAVVLEQCSKIGSTQQHHLIRRQQQQQRNHASVAATATIQQFNLKQSQQQSVQHVVHHGHQQQKQQQQVIQVSEELYEQAAAAGGNMMISTTGEVLNQQYFKIVTPDGSTGNMIIGPMGNVTAAGAQNSAAAANNNSKVLLSNVTVLSKQAASAGAVSSQQQQPQTINFVSTKNLSYLPTNTSSGGSVASAATNSSKQQKLMSSVASYKANAKQSQQQHIMSNTSSAAATTAYVHQGAQQQQHLVQKVTVPRNVQMVTRVQTLIQQQQQQHQQQHQQQSQMILQPQSSQQQPPQKYVVPVATKAGNVLKKQNSMKMSQQKMLSNIGQSGSVKTFIQQQHQQQQHQGNSNSQQHQSGPYQTTNKMKSQKVVKQYNNTINSSAGAVGIATLPQHNQSNQSALSTYTVNHKVNNHQQQSTKITKLPNNKFLMHNNQQQQQAASVMSSNTAANLPHGTQIHHKSMQQLQHASNSNNNVIMQQQPVLTTHSNANSSTIKFVNAHGTVMHQHHQQNTAQKQQRPVQQHHKQPVQQYPQQLQFVEAPVAGDNIYQFAPTTPQQQSSASTTSSSCTHSLISDDIMIVNGTQMTEELSARILQSMAQNSFGNQQRYQQQQMKCSTVTGAASSINMPPPPQIMIQHHTSNLVPAAAPNHVNLPSKEYPIYNPMQHQQQHATNYMLASNNIVSAGASCPVSSAAASRQVQSAPGSRSHSIERKHLETSIARKSSEYFKVNTNEILQSSHYYSSSPLSSIILTEELIDVIPLPSNQNSNSNVGTRSCTTSASGDAHATGQSAKTLTTDDDIIGEEVRPVPVSTHDVRLHILHAVLQDHTYANPTPTRFPTEMSTVSPTASQSISGVGQPQVSVTSTYGTPPTPLIPPQQWSLGGIGATVAQTGSMATASMPLPISTLSAQQTHLTPGGASSYTLYGQQIPRLQQDDDANSAISSGSRLATGDIDPGEETETAAEAEDDSVTRCICDLTHDDGYMICCDKCSAWQHVDCMGIDRQNIPDEYLCELCQPRQVDKERARALQLMKRKEQQTQLLISSHANSAASEGASSQIGSSSDGLVQQQRLGAAAGGSFPLSGGGGDTTAATRGSLAAPNSATPGGNQSTYNKKGKVLKKTKESGVANKRAKKAEKGAAAATGGSGGGGKLQRKDTKKTTKRKTKNSESSSNGNTGGTAAERHAANLRQWIENYELAVTNHYSPELRARLHAISKQPNLLQSITSTENKALKNCGRLDAKASTVPHAGAKILISNLDIPPHCPIFELRGKYMLTTQYKTQNSSINMNSPPPANYLSSLKAHKIPGPFIFFYQLPGVDSPLSNSGAVGIDGHIFSLPPPSPAGAQHLKGPEICVDTRTYGNEARFVRRSCRPNAEIQHLFEKGTIHLFIVSLIDIRASTEITIRHEPHDLLAIEHKRSSQLVIQPTSTACACGLVKDCLFGPPPQQSPTPGAVVKSTRKGITMNGSSAAALQLTMGGLPAPSTPLGKKRAQNNRNRSTSSSDSNMGLNSPNILPQGNLGISSNNVKSLNMLSSASFISTASNTFTSSAMNDSGICTSSSSPSVSIPSPSSHIHSPTQQPQHPQHCVHPLQKQTLSAVLQQRSLLAQHEQQQQQQNYTQVAALPTPMLLSPHQLLEQSQPQTPTLSVVATAASAVPNIVTVPQAPEPERQPEDVAEERIQEQQTIYVRLDQQNTPPKQQIMMPIHEDVVATTNAQPLAPNLPSPVPLTETNQNNNTAATRQSISPSSHTSSTSNAALLKHNSSDQLEAQQPKQQKQTLSTPSPMPSPQKQSITSSTSSGRKTSAKQLNSSRNTSVSEDAGASSDHQQPVDGDNTASTQSPSSSNNTTASPKEKPKLTRDERKMEAILRAIEKMEKSTQRKQEPKQPKRVSKRRQSEAPSVAEKQSSCDDTDATKSTVTEARNVVTVKKVSAAQGGSRKKKRKSQKKSYTTQNASALRKRRQSSLNSNESAEAAESSVNAVGAAAATAAGTTSESESNSLFSPSIQTMAQAPTEHNCIEQTSVEQMDNDSYNNDSTPDITEADSNVDHAAGLLMAFANPNNSVMSQEEPALHAAQHSPVTYMMDDDVFKSPVRLQTTRDPNTSASPPPTPPAPVSSACLLLEAAVGPLEPMDQQTVEFKYPISTQTKTKKVLMSNWLNQSDVPAMNCLSGLPSPAHSQPPPIACGSLSLGLDSLVQAAMSDYKQQEEVENFSMVANKVEEFIHQTEYPAPAAEQEQMCSADYLPSENYHSSPPESNPQQYASSAVRNLHLPLPVSTCSNNSSVKKRWLRQAISEETDESPLTPSSTSTPLASSPHQNNYLPLQNGFTTPLKKRRLVISSKDDGEEYANQSVSPPLSVTPTTTAHRDDESEIVDVGNNNEIAGLHLTTTPSMLPAATTMTPIFNHENSDLSTQMHSSSLLHVGFKPEMAMEQDDDVDIMGSPSPDSQNMVAEDNLVKIEPEDVSGNDVKIDVEREESEAFDKFEEIIQMKREAQQYTDAGDGRDQTTETTECKDEIKDVKITENHQSLTPKVEQKYDCFEQQHQTQCKPLLKMEDTLKQQPKLELQFGQFGSSSPKQSEEKTSLAPTKVVTSVRMPAPTVPPTGSNYVGSSGTVVSDEISSSSSSLVAPMASPSAAVVSTSKTCKTASADSTSSSRNKISRKSLSDDDIQERLHSFHKENILILQSRNKKTKTSAAPMSPARSSAKTDSKHSAVDSRSSTSYSRKPYQRTAYSSTTKNALRKERSNSFSKYSSSRNSCNSNLSNRSSSSRKSPTSSDAKTLKPLKKSHYSSTSNVLSSTTSSSSSSMVSVVSTTTSSNARERNRRSLSISSASPYPSTSSARKRQVNFEQELSKDTMLSNSGVSQRYRREDSTGNSYSSSVAKKRRDTISGEYARFVDHRSQKHKTNHPYHNADNRKLHSDVVMAATSTIDPPTTAAIVSEAKIAPTASIVMAPATPLPVGCSNSDSPSISHISQKAIPPSIALPSGLAAPPAAVTFATPAKCTSNLPYYNTVYGKLLDNSHHHAICNPSVGSPIDVIVSNCMAPASTANGCPTMLSEYLDTKARSYNSLGGYVSHTAALFGLNTSTKAQTSELRDLHTNPAVVTVPVTGTNTALELQTCTPPTAGTGAIIGMMPSLPKPLKILTKTASHDPRLNPNLTAPEPPVAPKRKLSINEYRKRKQQTTSSLILPSCATKDKSILASSTLLQTAIISKYATADILGKCATITTGSDPSDKSSYVATMNKCTLNSPERSLEIIRELHQKSLNDSTPINSGLSFANVEMPRMRVTEEDTSKVQFSAAPTLLEKQQEILCERIKSLKNKQSAADLVTGRLNVIGNDFALKKDDDMLHNRITISDLDSCLEAISSTSTSMTSSRESSPERRSRPSDTKYNKTTVDAKSASSGCAEEASQNPTSASATSLNSVVAATTSQVETTSTAKS